VSQPSLFDTVKLNLKKPLAFFDLESTGVDIAKDRIVEIGIIVIHPDQTKQVITKKINPTIPIPLEASQIHGIYDEDVITAPKFSEVAKELFDLLDPCDFAGFNSNRFDIPMLLEEFMRAGIALDIEKRRMVDIFRIYTMFEKRDLTSAYKFYCHKDLANAHSAEADIQATYEILLGQIGKYPDLQNDVQALHELSNQEIIIDSGRRFVYQNGKPSYNFGKHKGKSIEQVFKEDPSYYSWMLNGDFPAHTKQKLKEFKEAFEGKKKL
jgi:DNA polymerase-3 subunit epsilon